MKSKITKIGSTRPRIKLDVTEAVNRNAEAAGMLEELMKEPWDIIEPLTPVDVLPLDRIPVTHDYELSVKGAMAMRWTGIDYNLEIMTGPYGRIQSILNYTDGPTMLDMYKFMSKYLAKWAGFTSQLQPEIYVTRRYSPGNCHPLCHNIDLTNVVYPELLEQFNAAESYFLGEGLSIAAKLVVQNGESEFYLNFEEVRICDAVTIKSALEEQGHTVYANPPLPYVPPGGKDEVRRVNTRLGVSKRHFEARPRFGDSADTYHPKPRWEIGEK